MRALAVAPDLEPAHEGLIRAYADQGRSSAALRQYDTYVQVMKREYNAPPRTEITELTEQLRNGIYVKSQLETPFQAPVMPAADESVTPLYELEPEVLPKFEPEEKLPFIGRTQELEDLRQIISEVNSGRGQVVIISGEMGIGKTRLFNELLNRIPSDFFVGTGESQEIASPRPLEELGQILEVFGRDDRLPGEMKQELQRIFELQRKIEEKVEGFSEQSLMEAIRRWIIALAGRFPVLIALDDMHWAGESLLNIFSVLAQEARRLPLILVGIFRTFEQQSEDVIASALISIARTGRLRRFELGNLSFDDTVQLITRKAAAVADKLQEQDIEKLGKFSCGIPLYAVELANFLQDGNLEFLDSPKLFDEPDFGASTEESLVPPLMLKIANLRLSYLEKIHIELLKTASLILGDFSLEMMQKLLNVDTDTLEDMLVDLEHRNLLHHVERGESLSFAFNHLMIKLAITDSVPSLERRRIYKAIVNVIDETGEKCDAGSMAYYLYNSGEKLVAIPYLLSYSRLGFSYGNRRSGLRYSKVALQIAMENILEKPEQMVEVVLEHSDNLILCGYVKAAIDTMSEALTRLETGKVDRDHVNLMKRREELKSLLKVEPVREDTKQPPLVLITTKRALANVKLLAGELEEVSDLLDDAQKALDSMKDSPATLRETGLLFQVRAKSLIHREEFSAAVSLLENAHELLKNNGTKSEIGETGVLLGHLYRRMMKYKKSADVLQSCSEPCEGSEDLNLLAFYYHELGMLSFEQNRLEEAESNLRRSVELNPSRTLLTTQPYNILSDLVKVLSAEGKKNIVKKLQKEIKQAKNKPDDREEATDIHRILKNIS